MEYSAESLAKLSNISVRTLHYYDEIGLLKPAIRMANGRRFYGIEQVLRLMEILFFKEIGLDLKKINTVLDKNGVYKAMTLSTQKKSLLKEIKRLEKLTKQIDEKILKSKELNMDREEIEIQKELAQERVKEFMDLHEKHLGIEEMEKARELANQISEEQLKDMTERSLNFREKIISAIEENLKEDSFEVQLLMKEHFELSTLFKPMTKKQYLSSRDFLKKDSDFYEMYTKIHKKFPDFFYKATEVFASNNFFEKEN